MTTMVGPPRAGDARSTPPIRTLIVDDMPDLRRLYRMLLETSGRFDVVGEAGDGDSAIAAAAELQPTLVMLDVSMPRRDGMEALPEILRVVPDAKVVMITGFEAGRLETMARARGAVGFLEKGLAPDVLISALLEAVGEPADPIEAEVAPPPAPMVVAPPRDLLAVVAHELRTPLTAARGMAETLARYGEQLGPTARQELAGRIAAQCRHLDGIVDAVLQLSQGTLDQVVDVQTLDLDVSLVLIAADLRRDHPGTVIDVEVEPDLPEVTVDPQRLRQVLAALVGNAIEHSGSGAPIRLVARPTEDDVALAVIDEGIGIPPDARERVFEQFVRLDDRRRGIGLGLAVARALVTAMGGSIVIADAERGTEVVITLPATA